MTHPKQFSICAFVTEDERPAVANAARLLSESLSAASQEVWRVDCEFPSVDERYAPPTRPTVVLTSLVGWLEPLDEAWTALQPRLRSFYETLATGPETSVYACTILRHIGMDLDDLSGASVREAVSARRVRIRQLNLLAIELSKEIGIFIVDIDRDLADIGARLLQTDYRLKGDLAAEVAGKSISMALLLVGLDDIVPFELQEEARRLAEAYQPALPALRGVKPQMVGAPATPMRVGRRRQIVETTVDPVDENFVALQIRRLLKRQIGIREAALVFMGAIGRRGWRQSLERLIAGAKKAASLHSLAKR